MPSHTHVPGSEIMRSVTRTRSAQY